MNSETNGGSRAVRWAASLLAGIMLLVPAIWNRFPLIQFDTGGYLARWFEGYLVPSRPGAYGLLLAAAAPADFWPVLLVQVAVTLWILRLLVVETGLADRPFVMPALVAILSVATALPWLTSVLLTDIFAGLAVLALYLLVFGQSVGRPHRLGLAMFIAAAAATHSATLALVGALAICAVALAWWDGITVSPARAGQAAATAVLGVAATLAGNAAVSGQFAFTPGGYGILFGRMLQDGMVHRYLRDHCPERPLKLCPYRAQLPLDADTFLWGGGIFNRLGRFSGLGDEMRTVVLGSLADHPLEQAEAAVAASVSQLGKVATGEGMIEFMPHTYGIMERYTPGAVRAMRAARQQHGELGFETVNRLHVPVGLLSAALLPLLVVAGRKRPELGPVWPLAATIALALLANAFICGALANPHDRYGARLIWLAPLVLLLVPFRMRAAQSSVHRGWPMRSVAIRTESVQPPG